MKDFNAWNKEKQEIHRTRTNKFYHPRDIWWCSLGLNVGFEQDGTGANYERPVLIMKGFSKHVCLVIPLTTSQKKNSYYIPIGIIDGKVAAAIISQIRLIDTKRFMEKIAVLDEGTFQSIKKAVRELF
ncbi:MAG: hypothetical protein JWQ09_323 [Segetibacter sp.]|nr:hypothetical protein [Segetibacter sp.]